MAIFGHCNEVKLHRRKQRKIQTSSLLTTFSTRHFNWAHGTTGWRYILATAGSLIWYGGYIILVIPGAILEYTRSLALDDSLIFSRQGTYTSCNLCWNLTIYHIRCCCKYHWNSKKNTFHSRQRAEYIFSSEHDITAVDAFAIIWRAEGNQVMCKNAIWRNDLSNN